MTEREIVISILKELKPLLDFESIDNILDGEYLDSFELIGLISNLEEQFGIKIGFDCISADNFNSVDSIVAMIGKLKNKECSEKQEPLH